MSFSKLCKLAYHHNDFFLSSRKNVVEITKITTMIIIIMIILRIIIIRIITVK